MSLGRNSGKRTDDNGAPGVTRTPGPRFRKPLLYPPELQAHGFILNDAEAILEMKRGTEECLCYGCIARQRRHRFHHRVSMIPRLTTTKGTTSVVPQERPP